MKFKKKEQIILLLNKMKKNNYDLDVIKANPNCFTDSYSIDTYYKSLGNMFIEEGYYIYTINQDNFIKCYFKKQENNIYALIFVSEKHFNIYFEIIYDIDKINAQINVDDKIFIKNKEKMEQVIKEVSEMVMVQIACINYYATNSDITYCQQVERKIVNKYSNVSSKKNKTKNKSKKITLSTKVITIPNNLNNNPIKRSYIRRTESWKVKGFWRTYKNGKKVWIKPSVRGEKDKKAESNIYKLEK